MRSNFSVFVVAVCALLLSACATGNVIAPTVDVMGSASDDILDGPPAGPSVAEPYAFGTPDAEPLPVGFPAPLPEQDPLAMPVYDEDPAQPEGPPPAMPSEGEVEIIEAVPAPMPDDGAYDGGTISRSGSCNACCDCCDPEWPCSYLEFRGEVHPGIGVGINWGRRIGRTGLGTTYWEFGASFQDFWEPITGEDDAGNFWSLRTGIKVEFACDYCARFQPYIRGGIAFMHLTGEIDKIRSNQFEFEEDGAYFGGYVGVGVNISLGRKIRMGPEIGAIGGWGGGDFGWAPQFSWNFVIDF